MARANRLRERIVGVLAQAGMELDGPKPWDPRIRDERVYARIAAKGSLGLGEAYMDGWWECERLDELFNRLYQNDLEGRFTGRMASFNQSPG
jgi:cyclopropane-fatty-acyl-phospholipid synthase